ncbi:MAG: acyl-CoA dehydratase activase [Oscillospiraceae bacterium]|jgi:benzoyl-CoA reductase subunit D|nr:acyl-CoA dehydratase activase [Oscillospiraceae bacterium]
MITAGIDCGSQNTKGVVLKDGKLAGKALLPTEFDADLAAQRVLEQALSDAGVKREDVGRIVITGVGRDIIKWGDSEINEVGAAARGARFAVPDTDTVIDMGADSCRVIRLNADGSIVKYEVNDKCASGAGTFIEAMARALQIETEEMGDFSLRHSKELATNAQCVVFAESEVISLIHAKESREDIAYGVHMGIANRVASMIRRVGLTEHFSMIGGPAYNKGLVSCMSKVFGKEITVPENNQYLNAVGAAIFAAENQ